MKVSIKDFRVKSLDVGSAGIELDVYSPDGKKHLGDLYVTMTGLVWCEGKTTKANGKKVPWKDFIKWANER